MSIIYPPYIDGVVPPIVDGTVTIPFEMNSGVAAAQVGSMKLRVLSMDEKTIYEFGTTPYVSTSVFNCANGTATFTNISASQIVSGNFYKVQLAYGPLNETDTTQYAWSTVGVTRCLPVSPGYIEIVTQGELLYKARYFDSSRCSEPAYSYVFELRGSNNIVLQSKKGYCTEEYDFFEINQIIPSQGTYKVHYKVTTINGYTAEDNYSIGITSPTGGSEITQSCNYNSGTMEIALPEGASGYLERYEIQPNTNSIVFSKIERLFEINSNKKDYCDNTIEHGKLYRYGIYADGSRTYSGNQSAQAFFEHMYLSDAEKTLCISLNPKISNFKQNIQEQKTNTIGGKYPHFYRNGAVSYKEFQISGLVSYWMDENKQFMDLGFEDADSYQRSGVNWTVPNLPTTNQVDSNIYKERLFREAVLEWLNNGKPKLFRSPYEGNCIVRLSNINFTADDKLSRMIGTFTATATEIADYSMTEIKKHGLITTSGEDQTFISDKQSWTNSGTFDKSNIVYLKAEGLKAGTEITVKIDDETETVVNATGRYYYEGQPATIAFTTNEVATVEYIVKIEDNPITVWSATLPLQQQVDETQTILDMASDGTTVGLLKEALDTSNKECVRQVSFTFLRKSTSLSEEQWFSIDNSKQTDGTITYNKIYLFEPQVINIEERGAQLESCYIGPDVKVDVVCLVRDKVGGNS